ncbi:MAG: hypothetical protein AAB610_00300 [Patescibacteria group bacterium]
MNFIKKNFDILMVIIGCIMLLGGLATAYVVNGKFIYAAIIGIGIALTGISRLDRKAWK